MNEMKEKSQAFERLLIIMDELREQCPWDKKQTIESLRTLTIEETYELSEAILSGDLQEIKKEIGDILLHIVFYSKIASETKDFDIADVINSLCDKLINRHPHIYGDTKVKNVEEVLKNWEEIKIKEGNKSVLGGVPASLPSLIKAQRMQEKVAGVGFDWENINQVWDKIKEELQELEAETSQALENQNKENIEEEFGDLLFAMVNYARWLKINPEDALAKTNKKFIRRFQFIEEKAKEKNKKLQEMTLQEMDSFWEEAKKIERKTKK
jgi:XTP/dITP diphosphohydrolase